MEEPLSTAGEAGVITADRAGLTMNSVVEEVTEWGTVALSVIVAQ
jgi:hypothetical protein